MNADERQHQIVALARRQGEVDVAKLSAEMTVSAETIRRDLRLLEKHGLLRRTHGGAYPVETAKFETDLAIRTTRGVPEKRRIAAAACIFPVSQRETLDRSLGLRHRAALGITEESDAVAVVVSEETGAISICYRRRLERNFTPETFRQRLGEILLHRHHEEADPEQLARETDLPPARDRALVSHQEERSNDTLAV